MNDPFSVNSQYSIESINRHLINWLLALLMHYRRLVRNYEQHRDALEAMICIVLGSSLMHKMLFR
jgi:hypothetical protein